MSGESHKFTSQLKLYGYYGKPDPPPFVFDILGSSAWEGAQARGGIFNLRRYYEAVYDDDAKDEGGPIGLDYRIAFNDAHNVKAKWTVTSGPDYMEDIPADAATRSGTVVEYSNATANTLFAVTSTGTAGGGFEMALNQSWSIRFYLYKPPEGSTHHVFTLRWGKYQLQIIEGKAFVMRFKDAWSQTFEDSLHSLQANVSPTAEQDTLIHALIEQIYADYAEVDWGLSAEQMYTQEHLLSFIPEAGGRLNIIIEGIGVAAIKHTAILKTRTVGTMWESSTLTIRTTGGAFWWQVGAPVFRRTGEIWLPRFKTWSGTGTLTCNGLYDVSPPGTSIEIERDDINSVWSQLVVRFETTDTRYTPFFYHAQAVMLAGERNGTMAQWFDSNASQYLDGAGNNPVMDISPSFEGSGQRAQYEVFMRDVNGAVAIGMAQQLYELGEHRICDLWIDGTRVIARGVIAEAKWNELREATPNSNTTAITWPRTSLSLTVADRWAILDDMEMEFELIGDNMKCGDYLRLILLMAGEKASDIDIPVGAGERLPKASIANPEPAVKNSKGTTFGEWLRSVNERFGMGREIWIAPAGQLAGQWRWRVKRDTTIAATFSKDATYTGTRSRIMDPLDNIREIGDFWNVFRVEGDLDWEGKPIVAEWVIHKSIRRIAPGSRTHIGRIKKHPTVYDSGLRTISDVARVVRSLRMAKGAPGRYLCFPTHFHLNLYPGDYVLVDGTKCQVARINGGSIEDDTMNLVAREWEKSVANAGVDQLYS